jgi:hypothetical protein
LAQGDTIDIAGMDPKTDDATSELIHNDEYPVALQKYGFTPKQINTPETVLCVPEKC